ncbi:MAG TPA: RNA-binding protein [Gammaproteobacteria bacterium]|nr:RNA-binding protein [Gammaproteobacteria bacterium]
MATIYIGNLPLDTAEDALRTLFSLYGDVESVSIVRVGSTLKPRDFGFIEMRDRADAVRAARVLNGQYFHGALLHVESYDPMKRRVSNL